MGIQSAIDVSRSCLRGRQADIVSGPSIACGVKRGPGVDGNSIIRVKRDGWSGNCSSSVDLYANCICRLRRVSAKIDIPAAGKSAGGHEEIAAGACLRGVEDRLNIDVGRTEGKISRKVRLSSQGVIAGIRIGKKAACQYHSSSADRNAPAVSDRCLLVKPVISSLICDDTGGCPDGVNLGHCTVKRCVGPMNKRITVIVKAPLSRKYAAGGLFLDDIGPGQKGVLDRQKSIIPRAQPSAAIQIDLRTRVGYRIAANYHVRSVAVGTLQGCVRER